MNEQKGKGPFIVRILTILNFVFGSFAFIVGLIGIFGYSRFIGNSFTIFPLIIISILFLIFGIFSISAGFNLINGEKNGIKKSKISGFLFLFLFIFNTAFSIVSLLHFRMIGDFKEGSRRAHSTQLSTAEVENIRIMRKLGDIRYDEFSGDRIEEFRSVKDILDWLITPHRVYQFSFENEILEKIENPTDRDFISSLYDFDEIDRVYILKTPITTEIKDRIIQILIHIGYLRDYRFELFTEDGSPISDVPTIFYLASSNDKWNIAYTWVNEEDPYAKYYYSLSQYVFKESKRINQKNHHSYEIVLDPGETIYFKLDRMLYYNIRDNFMFNKLRLNDSGNLELDDTELRINFDDSGRAQYRQLGASPSITTIQRLDNDGVKLTLEWEERAELLDSVLDIYYGHKEELFSKNINENSFIYKINFEIERDGVYDFSITYDNSLPFPLYFYIFIFIFNFLYGAAVILLVNTRSVEGWVLMKESDNAKGDSIPENLLQIGAFNILLFPFIVWLSLGNLSGFLPSPHWWFTVSGFIGILIILLGVLGIVASYSLMLKNPITGFLMKLYAVSGIVMLFVNFIVDILKLNHTPRTLWASVDLLYEGFYASHNFIPRSDNLTAIFITSTIMLATGLLMIYPLFVNGKLRSELIKNFLNDLKNKQGENN